MTRPLCMAISLAVPILCLLGCSATHVEAQNADHKDVPSRAELVERIAQLESRVLELEEALLDQPRVQIVQQPRAMAVPHSAPKGWRRQEFNGLEYFIVPCREK